MADWKRFMFGTVYGYNILSVCFAIISAMLLNVLLFKSIHSKTKYILYRVEIGTVSEVLMLYMDRFIWRRLSNISTDKWHLGKLWRCCIVLFLFFVHLVPLFAFINTKEPTSIGWVSWVCTGTVILLCTTIALSDLTLVLLRSSKLIASESAASSRQSKIKEWFCIAVTLLYISAAYNNATSPPVVIRQKIPIAKLPPSMAGTKIVLLADIHLGATVGFTMMESAVNIANSLKPDITILAGDLADGTVEQLREAALPLKDLTGSKGKYFVTGNHEYYTSDVENWLQFLETVGFHVLHNSNVKVWSGNHDEWFCLLGTDDHQADIIGYDDHGVNLTKAFSGCDDNHAAILITHQPNEAKKALDSGLPIQLVLSGHTHRGQFFPANIGVYLASAYFAGLYQYNAESYVYVTQGTYYYGMPLRMFSYNEITEITLVSA